MMNRCHTFSDCRSTITLSSLKISNLYTIPLGFYGSPNAQNWMCELCTFSQIWSHIDVINTCTSLHSPIWEIVIIIIIIIMIWWEEKQTLKYIYLKNRIAKWCLYITTLQCMLSKAKLEALYWYTVWDNYLYS